MVERQPNLVFSIVKATEQDKLGLATGFWARSVAIHEPMDPKINQNEFIPNFQREGTKVINFNLFDEYLAIFEKIDFLFCFVLVHMHSDLQSCP